MKEPIEKLISRTDLTAAEAEAGVESIIAGVDPCQAAAFLVALRAKGAAHPKKEGDAAASSSGGTGPIGAIKGLMRRGSGTADDIAAGVAAADLGGSPAGAAKGKFARRNSNASKTLQEAAGGS